MRNELNVLALVKGGHRYVYVYDDASRAEVTGAVRDHAADPRLNLAWADARLLAARVQGQAARTSAASPTAAA